MSVPLVVLDARMTRQMSVGMKTYVRELALRLPKMAPDLRFVAAMNEEIDRHADMGVLHVEEKAAGNASLGELFVLPRLIGGLRPLVAHYPTPYAPRWSPYPYVYTIHDLIHRRFPEFHSWKIPPYYALLVAPVARAAAAVIVPTKATIPDAQQYLGVKSDRVRAVPMGVAESFRIDDAPAHAADVLERFGLRRTYFLYAGNHRRHKNLETLAQAWQRMEEACDLALTEDGPFEFDVDRYAKPNGRIIPLGHVEQSDLAVLYARSAGAVQPSLYEGFGLTVIEAMASGAPCVVADTPALVEVAGGAALTFPPLDVEALARAMTRLLREPDEAARLRAAGRGRSVSFSWDATARATAAVYREVIGNAA